MISYQIVKSNISILTGSIFLIAAMINILSCTQPINRNLDIKNPSDTLQLFGEGIVSTHMYERDLAISPNSDEIIFTMGDYKQTKRCLVRMKLRNGSWLEKEILAFSGIYQDIEPFITSDGSKLFFASDRPLSENAERNDYNIWVSESRNGDWSEPSPLPDHINTSGDEFYPSVSANGNLYFTATRPDGVGREDIFLSKWIDGQYSQPEVLDSTINTSYYEFNAYVTPDETLIVFSSFGRVDGQGGGDLYFSKKSSDGNWHPAQNMGELINSKALDYCPFIDLKNGVFYFTSDRISENRTKLNSPVELENMALSVLNGMGNIYHISTNSLPF